jgi:hypothetical protein
VTDVTGLMHRSRERARVLPSLITAWLKPELVFLPFVALGILFWLLPPANAGGFRYRERITPEAVLLIAVWYLTIVLMAYAGRRVGQQLRLPRVLQDSDENRFYVLVTITAATGVAFTWFTVLREIDVLSVLSGHTANLIKLALYEDYTRGLHTLRYAVAISGALAFLRIARQGRIGLADAVNVAMLLSIALISARILLAQAVFIALGLSIRYKVYRLLRPRTLLVISLLFGLAVSAMTFVRSAGTYVVSWGVTNPLTMGYIETKRYLGAPIQVSLGTARLAFAGLGSRPPSDAVYEIVPSFLSAKHNRSDHAGGIGQQWYLGQVDVSAKLTRNSAFSIVLGVLGAKAIPFIGIVSFVLGLAYGWLHRGGIAAVTASLVVLYGFAELWRTYYFASGSFVFLVGLAIALGVFCLPVRSAKTLGTI